MPGKPPGMPPPPAAEALDLISFSRCLRILACLLFSLSSALVWDFSVWVRRPDVLGFLAKNALSPLLRPPFSRVTLKRCFRYQHIYRFSFRIRNFKVFIHRFSLRCTLFNGLVYLFLLRASILWISSILSCTLFCTCSIQKWCQILHKWILSAILSYTP